MFEDEFCIQFALCGKAYIDGLIKRMKEVDHPTRWSDDTFAEELGRFQTLEPQAARLFQFSYLSHLDLIGRTTAANSGSRLLEPFFRAFVTSFANAEPRTVKEYVGKYTQTDRTNYVQELIRGGLRALTNDDRKDPPSVASSRRSARGVSETQRPVSTAGSQASRRRPQAKILNLGGGGSVFHPGDSVSVVPIMERSVASLWKTAEEC